MNTITLNRLTLRDFQGGTITVEAGGENVNVFGSNGSGKTRIMSALLWLLTGKDSLGRADFEIKNIDGAGNREHGLEHTVEAVFSVGGNDLTLKKIYHEVWTKKRGSAKAEMTGNTNEYFIDGVPAKENEYKARVSEVFGDEERFRLLTNPAAFALMPWQKQRSLLLSVCGDISDGDIIGTDESLMPLSSALIRYTASKTPLDDLKKVTMGRRTEINKTLSDIPVRIDEARRGLPDVTGLDKAALSAEITALETELNGAKLRMAGVDTGGTIAPLTKELNAIASEISRLENTYSLDITKSVMVKNDQIRDLLMADDRASRKIKAAEAEIAEKQAHLATVTKNIETLREKWEGVDGEEFQDSTELICFACKQSLPEDKVEAAREKALAAFNASKAERLADIQVRGKRLATERDGLVKVIEGASAFLSSPPDHKPEIERLKAEYEALKIAAGDFSGIIGRDDLLNRRAGLEKAIADAKGSVATDRAAIAQEIGAIEAQLAPAREKHGRFANRAAGEKRITELKAEEKKLAGEFEELEKMLYLIENFIKTKVSMLSDKINDKFRLVRFALFEIQVNGALNEICEMTVNGIGYNSGLNNAARINGGLDVIAALQKHYGISTPVFCDNAESVVDLYPLDCQVIRLVVSGEDKTLRVETANKETAARKAA